MTIQSVDKAKRGRIIIVSAIVTFLAFFVKISQQSDTLSLLSILFNATLIGAVAYIGLMWAVRFMVTLRSLVFVLSQASLVVIILTSFLEMFVFRRVGRVYEILILLLVSGVMFFGTYASFLMANIFNVAQFKELPLVQVGKTTSFILTILSVYFFTYVVLASQSNIYVTIILLAVTYFFLLLFHIRHLNIERNVLWKRLFLILALVFLSIMVQIVIGGNPFITALVPTVVAYSFINLLTSENITNSQKFEYYLITVSTFVLNFFIPV